MDRTSQVTTHPLTRAEPHASYVVFRLMEMSQKERELLASVGVVEGATIQVERRLPGGALLVATADTVVCVAASLAEKIIVSPHTTKTAVDV